MIPFCLLWIPVVYLFWTALSPRSTPGGSGICAILAGCLVAVIRFFSGPLVEPAGFGNGRWWSGFTDLVSLPVLIPFGVYVLLWLLGVAGTRNGPADPAAFVFLWVIPDLALKTIGWSARHDPILLMGIPLLRTAVTGACALGFRLIFGVHSGDGTKIVGIILGIGVIAGVPVLATSAYRAFFAQQPHQGLMLGVLASLPCLVEIACRWVTGARRAPAT